MKTERNLMYKGKSQTIKQWSVETGIHKETLWYRCRKGWDVDAIFETPVKPRRRILEHDGKSLDLTQWGKVLGMSGANICDRFKSGKSIAEVLKPKREVTGKYVSGGYVMVKIFEDSEFTSMCKKRKGEYWVLEHRLVMAQYLKRPLIKSETVHHLNGDTTDNRLSNLQLRIGNHGKGQAYCCADCGSNRLNPRNLGDQLA